MSEISARNLVMSGYNELRLPIAIAVSGIQPVADPPSNRDPMLCFGSALNLMKKGLVVARRGWPDGQHVGISPQLKEFVMYYHDHAISGWGFTPGDLLANDWLIFACNNETV